MAAGDHESVIEMERHRKALPTLRPVELGLGDDRLDTLRFHRILLTKTLADIEAAERRLEAPTSRSTAASRSASSSGVSWRRTNFIRSRSIPAGTCRLVR
jgi:hypothetical protein